MSDSDARTPGRDPRVPAGPVKSPPGGFIPEDEQRTLLAEALVGIELGEHDSRILDWLASWETSTVLTVVSLFERAREAGYTDRRHDDRMDGLPVIHCPPDCTCRGTG